MHKSLVLAAKVVFGLKVVAHAAGGEEVLLAWADKCEIMAFFPLRVSQLPGHVS